MTISVFLSFANYPIFSCKQISTDYRHLFSGSNCRQSFGLSLLLCVMQNCQLLTNLVKLQKIFDVCLDITSVFKEAECWLRGEDSTRAQDRREGGRVAFHLLPPLLLLLCHNQGQQTVPSKTSQHDQCCMLNRTASQICCHLSDS